MSDETTIYVCHAHGYAQAAFVTLSARDALAWLADNTYSGEVNAWAGGQFVTSYVASTMHLLRAIAEG